MTSLRRLSAIFPDNAITRAERVYQRRSAKKPRTWRRWLSCVVRGFAFIISFMLFGGFLICSFVGSNPTAILDILRLPSTFLMVFAVFYHFYLMFQTLNRAANSIAREKESQTWELLVLTGVDARQIVRGKWCATVQRQFPNYLFLGLLRVGALSAIAIGNIPTAYSVSGTSLSSQIQLPHPAAILLIAVFGLALPIANLGLSAACGVMGSTAVRSTVIAIPRGVVNQIIVTLFPTIYLVLIGSLFSSTLFRSDAVVWWQTIVMSLGLVGVTLIDNGIIASSLLVYPQYNNTSIIVDGALLALILSLVIYGLIIWVILRWAELNAVGTRATPFKSNYPL